MIKTDYTAKANPNTLCGASLGRYRATHWLLDIIKNFMSDPINILDERLRGLLFIQNGPRADECRALFQVAMPYDDNTRQAGVTPAILVSAGTTGYPVQNLNVLGSGINNVLRDGHAVCKTLELTVACVTESYDGTNLLIDLLENFLLTRKYALTSEGMITSFNIKGSSEIQALQPDQTGDAKTLYQGAIGLDVAGTVKWSQDVQGPVYRGVELTGLSIEDN